MARRSKDYIPTEGEQMAKSEAIRDYMATHKDPRTEYIATYTVPSFSSREFTERVMAVSITDAENIIKRNCGMVGWIPTELKIVEA